MYIADTHSDTLFAMAYAPNAPLMITPDRLRQGGVTLQVCALWTGRDGNKGDVDAITTAELAAIPRLTQAGIRQVSDPCEAKPGEHCFMLSIEGGEVFEKGIHTVQQWRDKGVRIAALLWNNENALGYPAKSGDHRGLTAYGLQVVKEMQRTGMAVDVSHLNDAGFFDIFAKTNLPPMASHSCCRAMCNHFRNLTDEQLCLMIREGGFVGVNFYPHFLSEDGKADAALIARHIDHICQLGGAENVGFGSDFDGIEVTPTNVRHPGEIPNLLEELRRLGYDDAAIAGIAGENLLKYFQRIA